MAAPGFDSESNLHRAGSDWLIRMRMEAWVEAESSLQEKLLLTGRGRLMEGHRGLWPVKLPSAQLTLTLQSLRNQRLPIPARPRLLNPLLRNPRRPPQQNIRGQSMRKRLPASHIR